MLSLGCKIHLKKPCHVGFRQKGRQVLDDKGDPYLPSYVLGIQMKKEASRFARAQGKRISPPFCTDALIPEEEKVRILRVRGKEYFLSNLFFELSVEEKDAPFYLAALKSIQNAGFGGDTSLGFGYGRVLVVESNLDFDILGQKNRAADILCPGQNFPPLHFVRLNRSVFGAIRENWREWEASYNPGPFATRHYYKIASVGPLTRRILRTLLLNRAGIKHEGVPVCLPQTEPCQVCALLGCLRHKSRIIFRAFPQSIFLVCENLKEKERDLLEDALREGGYKFCLQKKETLESYLK